MTRAVVFDDNGNAESVTFYASTEEAHGFIISDHDTPDEVILETWYVKNGAVKLRAPAPSQYHFWDNQTEAWVEDLTYLREDSLQRVDQEAEAARLRHITPGSGQAMTYEQKLREALAGDGPLLQAEAEALGVSAAEVAKSVIAAHTLWQQAGSRIEALRLKAKRDIREATTAQEIHDEAKALELALAEL